MIYENSNLHWKWGYFLVAMIAPHFFIIICICCSFTFWTSHKVELLVEVCYFDVSFNTWILWLHICIQRVIYLMRSNFS